MSNSCDSWTVAHQALCPWDFLGKNTGVAYHFLLHVSFRPRGQPMSLVWQVNSLSLSHSRVPLGLHIKTVTLIVFKAQSYLKITSFSFILSSVNFFNKILKCGHKRLISVLLVLRIANFTFCNVGPIFFFFFLRISSALLNDLWKLTRSIL